MDSQFAKRFKSFVWRGAGMAVVATLAFFIEPDTLTALTASGVTIPSPVVVILGLVLGEVTKMLNKK